MSAERADLFFAPVEMIYVVSLWQPHASLMFAYLDDVRCKPDETRHWPFPASLRGQRVVIHAAQRRVTRDEAESALGDLCAKLYGPNWRADLPYGAYLGDVRFDERLRMADHGPLHDLDELCGHWNPTRWAWRTTEPRPLVAPIRAKGQQGFWKIPVSALSRPSCVNHPDQPSVTNLDSEDLCQECANAWVRGEGQAAAEREAEEAADVG